MRPMTYDEMQVLLTYILSCQPDGKAQQQISKEFRQAWGLGDTFAMEWLAKSLNAIVAILIER